jgi:hypothetical protein
MTARNLLRTLAAVVALTAVAVGCSSSAKQSTSTTSAPKASGSNSNANGNGNKNFHVGTPNGQVSVSLDGQLPPNWPSEFPVAPGASPAGSGSLGNKTKTTMVGVFSTTGSAADAFNFYKSSNAYTVDHSSSGSFGSGFLGSVKFSGSYQGSVTILSLRGTNYIVVVLETGGPGSTTTNGATTTTF